MSVPAAPRSRRIALVAASLGTALVACLAMFAGSARADGVGSNPAIQWHAAFSSGQSTGLTAGTPIVLSYNNPAANTSVRQFCWSPAPIDRPACGTSNTGAPAQSGVQTITATLANGQSVSTQLQVSEAATQLQNGATYAPPVLYTATCSIALSGDANLSQVVGMITSGQQLAGYYQPRPSVTQVYDYSTNTAGFIPTVCLSGAADDTVSYQRTVTLRSNHTATYRLSVPPSFKPITNATPLAYQLYRGNQVGSGVGNSIPLNRPSGRHEPFLGATVTRTTYSNNTVSVTITTKRVRNLTLRLSAIGQGTGV
jgi:hypothetical protein